MSSYKEMHEWVTGAFKEFPERTKPVLIETIEGFKISCYIPELKTRKYSRLFGINSFCPVVLEFLLFIKETERYYKKADKIFTSVIINKKINTT